MAQKNIHPYAESIKLRGSRPEAVLLIHGYTGSPTDFNGLPSFVHEKYNLSVVVPRLPGHGSEVEDLRGLTKDHFIETAEKELKYLLKENKSVIVGGHSFGGQVALYLASHYDVSGVFITDTPYKLSFPLSLPGLYTLWRIFSRRESFQKKLSEEQRIARKDSFSYMRMPAYGLKLLNEINKDLRNNIHKIKSPILSVYSKGDPIAHLGSAFQIEGLVNSKSKKSIIFDSASHGIFYTENAPQVYREFVEFFKL